MQLPTRILQHKAESDSYAILLYKLRNIGIFRNVNESDYGIDFEIEIVHGSNFTRKYFMVNENGAAYPKRRVSQEIR